MQGQELREILSGLNDVTLDSDVENTYSDIYSLTSTKGKTERRVERAMYSLKQRKDEQIERRFKQF